MFVKLLALELALLLGRGTGRATVPEEAVRLVQNARALADFEYNRNYRIRLEEFEQAEKELLQALQLAPRYFLGHLVLGNVYSGKALLYAADDPRHIQLVDKALKQYRRAVKLEPENVAALTHYVNTLLIVYARDSVYSTQEREEIQKTFQTIFSLAPNQYREKYNYGLLLIRFGDTEQGIAYMREAIKHLPWRLTIDMKGDLADILESLGRIEEAIEVLKTNGTAPWEDRIARLQKQLPFPLSPLPATQ